MSQLLNQAPPGAQQLSLLDLALVAHLGHAGAILVAVTGSSVHYANTGQYHIRFSTLAAVRCFSKFEMSSACYDVTFFAGLQAFEPRVLDIAAAPTVIEPSTARSATTEFAGFLDGTALRAFGSNCFGYRRRG